MAWCAHGCGMVRKTIVRHGAQNYCAAWCAHGHGLVLARCPFGAHAGCLSALHMVSSFYLLGFEPPNLQAILALHLGFHG